MEYPKIIRKAAQWYIDKFGERLHFLGTRDGYAYYSFYLPTDQEIGFPPVYKTDGHNVETIYGFDALHIINSFL